MDRQSVVCHKCTGVLLATDSRTYTAQRGRLILTNGYCTCPAAAQAPADSADLQSHPQAEPQPAQAQGLQPTVQPQAQSAQGHHQIQTTGQNAMVVA
ncbi:hypothetical protein FHS43_003692 [Streptosporangium becharense]|uniref:Uncharacterized protein n=1 Tax=Streptosporangium becharense TaxID=1816182 RepID=A0A7W9IHF5_9ACTN|nr:hypothetical protein [Streptosporangium becharense]MBB2912409.1 hypothetical protein [Streptosporangium becharense]MBB5820762.1 hypothetical protein [Streptosporangium becharense]